MTTEIRNWAIVAAAMEAQGATNSQMYRRAKALATGAPDPMPTSYPAALFQHLSCLISTQRQISPDLIRLYYSLHLVNDDQRSFVCGTKIPPRSSI